MGLFDEVRCDYPLPDGKPGTYFQTKTFDAPYIEQYRITPEGRLLREEPPWYERIPVRGISNWVDTNFHGVLNFYDYDTKTKVWRNFNAIFTHGQLELIQDVSGRRG